MIREKGSRLLLALAAGIAACGGDAHLSGPPDGNGGGLRPGLTVTVGLDPEASGLGQQLGWGSGVPGAEVWIHRIGTEFRRETATTDASGVARFPNAITGRYRVAAYRPLEPQESGTLGGAALAFGDGLIEGVTDGGEATLRQTSDHPGSLVISEVYATFPFVAETDYSWHLFFELYNNSDQTVYLDGMLWGTTLGIQWSSFSHWPCSSSERWRNDPTGIWARLFHQFPGSGTEHPVAPGQFVLVALDAVDHSAFHPVFPDLSGADFELLGNPDVDNPDVPNLPEVGLEPYGFGHGLRFSVSHVFFLAERLDISALERGTARLISGDSERVKIPADALIDVVATERNDAFAEQQFPPCDVKVHRSFDRLGGGFIEHGEDLAFSVQRRVIGTRDGRVILQDTNTSAVDLVRAAYTPGQPPP